jgi:hypothetical protein
MNSTNVNGGERRGFALLTVIMLTLGMAALAASAVYLAGNAGLLATSTDREREFKYGAEAAMAIGKSRLNVDPLVLPDSGYVTLMSGQAVVGADGQSLPGVTVNLYTGPTGSTSGQFGRFASVVAEARDASGARFVRRLELTQENFARFAYWSNQEKNASGGTIVFANNDNIWGPVWSNDVITIASSGAKFHGEVGTAKTISGKNYGTFDKGYTEGLPAVTLPNNTVLSKLAGYAAGGFTNFAAPSNGAASTVRLRLEFIAIDLGTGTADSTGVDEGFVRVYQANAGEEKWLRGDWETTKANARNCGASYRVGTNPNGTARMKFFPASVHGQTWMRDTLVNGGSYNNTTATTVGNQSLNTIMSLASARCYLGGDPHLVAEDRKGSPLYTAAQEQVGGDTATAATFTPNGVRGHWLPYLGPIDPRVLARRPADAGYLFPIYRGLNPGTKGVITVAGTAGISGVLRGKVTVYATGSIVILDDQRYATDPSISNPAVVASCPDMLGMIAGNNITVADNALQDPPDVGNYRNMDDTKDVFIHGVMMAINTSFGVENHDQGPNNAMDCEGTNGGRGCLYLNGGIIQERRGAVGLTDGTGFIKRYSYDRCALSSPPPYFPTTGRFLDNRYYEIDPVRFDIAALFAGLVPN